MAGKRQATSELNHDNWDREEEPEERGTFRTATEDELKSRVIKKAKRKIEPSTNNDTAEGGSGAKSVFSGFTGFGKPSATTTQTSASPFSFLSKIPAVGATTSGVVSSSTTSSNATPHFFGSSATAVAVPQCAESSKSSSQLESATNTDSKASKSAITKNSSEFKEYYENLASLNKTVSEWIKSHVDKNPICILSPIFKDYEKHLKKIEDEKKKETKNEVVSNTANEEAKPSGDGMKNFKFSSNTSNKHLISTNTPAGSTQISSETVLEANGFRFELKKPENTSSLKPSTSAGFTFGLSTPTSSSTCATSTSFSFGMQSGNSNETPSAPKPFSFTTGATPFTFGNIQRTDVVSSNTATSEDKPTEEEDEEPPKNEFKQVVEEEAVYSKKCKVFVKKEGNFVDKGVGTLYLKPIKSSDKTQLLVRADTNLGNILVNLILNAAIPAQRMGKNNVMLVCLPTPDAEKPTSMLLRVKTSEEAAELLDNIDKYKK